MLTQCREFGVQEQEEGLEEAGDEGQCVELSLSEATRACSEGTTSRATSVMTLPIRGFTPGPGRPGGL